MFDSGQDHDAVGESTLHQKVKRVPVIHSKPNSSTPNTKTNLIIRQNNLMGCNQPSGGPTGCYTDVYVSKYDAGHLGDTCTCTGGTSVSVRNSC